MTSANKQPRWDLYESAILLEAVQNVEAGIESKNDAIKRVSSMLRRMATNRGLIIDDTFRNVNGITFQFQSMEYSAYGRLGTTHKTGSKVFDEIVALFCNNNAEYLDILHIAYSQIGVTSQEITHNQLNDSKKSNDNKDNFRNWLINQGKTEEKSDWIVASFGSISDYAIDKKVISIPLFELFDIKKYNKAIANIQNYKFFRVLKNDLYKFLLSNSKLYATYLKSIEASKHVKNSISVNEELYLASNIDKTLYEKYGELISKIYDVLRTNEKQVFLTAHQISMSTATDIESVEEVLSKASWAEKLSDGYILGQNASLKEKEICFDVESAYEEPSRWEEVMMDSFRRGFRPSSIMDKNRFLTLYSDRYNERLSFDDLMVSVQHSCFQFDGRFFLPKALVKKRTAQEMADFLASYFKDKDILFFSVLYSLYEKQFESFIYSPEMMAAFLQKVIKGSTLYFRETYCAINANSTPDISTEVKDYLIRMDIPCSYEMIYEAFPYYNQKDIYYVLHYNHPDILGNSKNEYFHVKTAHISEKEFEVIRSVAESLLNHSRFITCNEIMDHLRRNESVLMDRLDSKYSMLGIRRLLTYYLRMYYDVDTGIVTYKGQKMSVVDAFADFAQTHKTFTTDDVQSFADYIGTVPYWETIQSNAVRINATEFVSDNDVDFDEDAIDSVIDYYCNDYITLSEIHNYSRFPSCGATWNIYLLQQYVYRFSKQFRLLFLGFAKGTIAGVIVRKQSDFDDFDSIVIDALEKTKITSPNDAIEYLCKKGFIAEKRYKKHGDLLKIAVARRNSK